MRVVLITGAAGGLGRALVAEFAAQGWRVAAACHRPADAQPSRWAQPQAPANSCAPVPSPLLSVAKDPQDRPGIWPLKLDVTHRPEAFTVTDQILSRWGRLDVLVNNAGLTLDHPVWQMPAPAWEQVLAVNLKGACWCAQAVLRPMLAQRDGHIINIGSWSARAGQRGQTNYAAAKAGLLGLAASLARELGPQNIRVNTVLPGVLPTPMTASLQPAALAEFAQANALGRLNSVNEVARFIVFLSQTQNISGQFFHLDSRIPPWT